HSEHLFHFMRTTPPAASVPQNQLLPIHGKLQLWCMNDVTYWSKRVPAISKHRANPPCSRNACNLCSCAAFIARKELAQEDFFEATFMAALHSMADPSKTARTVTILVIEDEVLVRAVLAEDLRDRGYVIIEAANAGEAL